MKKSGQKEKIAVFYCFIFPCWKDWLTRGLDVERIDLYLCKPQKICRKSCFKPRDPEAALLSLTGSLSVQALEFACHLFLFCSGYNVLGISGAHKQDGHSFKVFSHH